MTFENYWNILLKQWKFIFACLVSVGLGAYIGSRLMIPLYQSTVLVQVTIRSGSNAADYTNLLASDQLVQTEAQLATSDPVLREVASHYPDMPVERLASAVAAAPKINTQLFEVDVLNPSSQRAAVLANDIAATLIRQQLQMVEQDERLSQQQIQQELASLEKQINRITAQITTLQAQQGNQSKIGVLQEQLNGLQQHDSQWQTALVQLELAQAQNENFLRVVQPAYPGLSPVQPRVLLNTSAGLLAGLCLGIVLAILFDKLDVRVRTAEALTQLLDIPVLATVWRVRASYGEEVINPAGHSAISESYRILRTSIGFLSVDKPLCSLMVTSAVPQDGKSVVAANLAIFMAKAGKNTLLIDADLHRPTVHEKFNLVRNEKGLSNAILAFSTPPSANALHKRSPVQAAQPVKLAPGCQSLDPFIHDVGIPYLRVMPSGPLPPNPAELLDSKAANHLFQTLANSGAEVIIFDTPPLLGLADSSLLASKVDGVLLVTDITTANKKDLKQVKELLTRAGAHVLGYVANKQRRSRHSGPYGYYYYQSTQNYDGGQSRKEQHSPVVPAKTLSSTKKKSR